MGSSSPLFERLGRIVDFDIDEGHIAWRGMPLGEWLDGARPHLAGRYGPATLAVRGTPESRHAVIRATSFLLETAFGNLWANAVQAAEQAQAAACHITADFWLDRSWVEVLLSDNGPGFTAAQVETAFRVPFSTKSASRGRGLLEVCDAISRLQGTVRLVQMGPDEYRAQIRLPLEAP